VRFTAPITPPVRAEIERLAKHSLSAADITRSAGATAERFGQRRPSYERVRMLVDDVRHPRSRPFAASVLVNFAFRAGRRNWWWSLRAGTHQRAGRK
jgi:hypothetical protein